MSNIGKQSINIPDNTEVVISGGNIKISGKMGSLDLNFDSKIEITQKDGLIQVSRNSDSRKHRELHGLYRALINNMVIGVNEGFSKELNMVGVGYTA